MPMLVCPKCCSQRSQVLAWCSQKAKFENGSVFDKTKEGHGGGVSRVPNPFLTSDFRKESVVPVFHLFGVGGVGGAHTGVPAEFVKFEEFMEFAEFSVRASDPTAYLA